ncbi:alpha/beta fold hydrolase [Mycolicibacterium sarraceniae]|uniref:Hydrolase n=1 Tax=Mycolicibacterium sarraceniae TaxID=1534348 RepID=A0A7I7SSE1_9MYCO|nr:alpha/beta hydrolase [Mycolicibacterium sarraceniae]BBY59261.1 hydrolase [Mycolicibacterium sarraceniae]
MDVATLNNVTRVGNAGGPTVMLAHGFGCDQQLWHPVAARLREQFDLVLFDHVGSGNAAPAAWNPDKYALTGYADDVVELVEALDLSDVVLVGHCVAAMIGALAVASAPARFAKLVMITPSPRHIDELLDSLESNYVGWPQAMAPTIMGNADRPELAEDLAATFCRTDPAAAKVFARATFLSDNRADLESVPIPTLVVDCRQDAIAPPEVGAYVRDHIPSARLSTLDATGHCPHVSAPDATAEVVAAFAG